MQIRESLIEMNVAHRTLRSRRVCLGEYMFISIIVQSKPLSTRKDYHQKWLTKKEIIDSIPTMLSKYHHMEFIL